MTLHCPKCGDVLTESATGGLECVRGQMGLAQELEQRLRECYVAQTRRPLDTVFTYGGQAHGIGGNWFCPGCGCAVPELTPGDLRCPVCSRSLAEFVYALVELHPHFYGVNRWK